MDGQVITGSIMSDLHLEFKTISGLPAKDILILSGDIWLVPPMRLKANDRDSRKLRKRYLKFIEEELSKFKIVFLVMGNHEHYGSIFEDTANILKDFLDAHCSHAILLDNEYYDWQGVRFIGSTLWATYGQGTGNHYLIQKNMNDFHCIRTMKPLDEYPVPSRGRTILVPEIASEHLHSKFFLTETLQTSKLPCVVITHHAPSYLCDDEMGPYSDGYASNQHNLILTYQPVMWTHGHTHISKRLWIDRTLVVSNQRGYFGMERCANFFDPEAADFTIDDIKERKLDANAYQTGTPFGPYDASEVPYKPANS